MSRVKILAVYVLLVGGGIVIGYYRNSGWAWAGMLMALVGYLLMTEDSNA